MCPDKIGWDKWDKAAMGIKTATPESQTIFTYPGFSELLRDLQITTPEDALTKRGAELKLEWDKLVRPHSPLTPEEGWERAGAFAASATGAHAALTAIITAIEVAGMGQLETPATMASSNPALRAFFDGGADVLKTVFDAAFLKAARYKVNADHQPTIIPEAYLVEAVNMGILPQTLYTGQMLYHGYTETRSSLIARTQVKMPSFEQILELTRRGELSRTGATDWLELSKIPRPTADTLMRLTRKFMSEGALMELNTTGQISSLDFNGTLTRLGYTAADVDYLSKTGWKYLDLDTLLELWRRGILPDVGFTTGLTKLRIPREYHGSLQAVKRPLYPLPDLIRMMVREAFVPEEVIEAPPLFTDYIKQYGYEKVDADRWWTSAKVRMDLRQAYENLWRGHFDIPAFERYLRLADLHPGDWDAIERVAFRPPSIREMGYGFDVAEYTEEDITRYRRWGGLSPEDAAKAAKAMVAYRTEAEREAVRREHLHLYAMEKIDRSAFEAALRRIKTAEAAIPLWLERGDLERERRKTEPPVTEARTLTRTDAQYLYEHGRRTADWLRGILTNLGYAEDAVQGYLDQSDQRILERAKEPGAPVARRILSDANVRTGWELGLIPGGDLITRFEAAGYVEDAPLLAEISTRSALSTEINLVRDNAKKDLVSGYITETQLRDALRVLNLSQDVIDYHVTDAVEDQKRWIRDESVKAYEDGYNKGVIETEEELATKLAEVIVNPEIVKLRVALAYYKRLPKPKA